MDELISGVLAEIDVSTTGSNLAFIPKVIRCAKNAHSLTKDSHEHVFVLDERTCQIHVFSSEDNLRRNTLFLTPQPSSCPVSMLISPDENLLAILSDTSAHVVDISKMKSIIRSKQEKNISKLATVFDSFSGDSVTIRRLVRVRWHPYIPNLLVLLLDNSRLLFCRCVSGGSLRFENELIVNLLETPDHDEDQHAKVSGGLNLSEAMGAVCCDFDFGSSLFFEDVRFSRDAPLCVPIYIICENGDILLVSASPVSINKPLVRFVRIVPSIEDCYTFDFSTLMCLRSGKSENHPDIICFANRAGRIFHGPCLHVPPSVLLQSSSCPQGRSVPVLFLIDSVDLELPVLDKSFELSMKHEDEKDTDPDAELELALVPASYLSPPCAGSENTYFCLHNFGIHHVRIPWVDSLRDLYSSMAVTTNLGTNLLETLRSNVCCVEYLLLTQSLNSQTCCNKSQGRSVIGLLPKKASRDSPNDTDTYTALTVFFTSKPETVTMRLPSSTPLGADLASTSGEKSALSLEEKCTMPMKSASNRLEESGFVKNCRRSLKASESFRLPVISSADDEVDFSEPEFFRLFLSATDSLRTSQLSQLAGLSASVRRFADYVEGQLAAQSEEVVALSELREALHAQATCLTDRHVRILERQEAINHRISELARRIYSINAGLTNAEVEMRSCVQNLRDRLKSGLLGWLENIRLQYDHLITQMKEQRRISAGHGLTERSRGQQSASLPPAQIQGIVSMLKAEGSEIDVLIKAVEKINLISNTVTTAPLF